jgi:biopolymer transport protein ExbD
MKLPDSTPETKGQIPIVPLIDVVFLLLASFVVATLSMTMVKGMSVDLPQAKGEVSESDVILIVVSAENEISIGGEPMAAREAALRASEMASKKDMPIVIRGDKVSGLGMTVSLIDELRSLGVRKLSFQVEEK